MVALYGQDEGAAVAEGKEERWGGAPRDMHPHFFCFCLIEIFWIYLMVVAEKTQFCLTPGCQMFEVHKWKCLLLEA